MGRTLEEWIERYNKKNDEPFARDIRYELAFNPDKGFCEFGQTESMIVIRGLCGDGKYFKERAEKMARAVGFSMCGAYCTRREIKAYIRLFGYVVEHTEETSDGLTRYICRHKDSNKQGRISPAYKAGETPFYFVTWEV